MLSSPERGEGHERIFTWILFSGPFVQRVSNTAPHPLRLPVSPKPLAKPQLQRHSPALSRGCAFPSETEAAEHRFSLPFAHVRCLGVPTSECQRFPDLFLNYEERIHLFLRSDEL